MAHLSLEATRHPRRAAGWSATALSAAATTQQRLLLLVLLLTLLMVLCCWRVGVPLQAPAVRVPRTIQGRQGGGGGSRPPRCQA
jgi:uncharacterized protein (DUF58 family)